MQGKRVDVDETGHLYLEEGEYGKHKDGNFYCRPFGAQTGSLANHQVVEHEDGTITASPSILIKWWEGNMQHEWHGYLERGIWRKC